MPDVRVHLLGVLWERKWDPAAELEHEMQAISLVLQDNKTAEAVILSERFRTIDSETADRLYFSYPVLMWGLMKLNPAHCQLFRNIDAIFWVSGATSPVWRLEIVQVTKEESLRRLPAAFVRHMFLGKVLYFPWEEIPPQHRALAPEQELYLPRACGSLLSSDAVTYFMWKCPPGALPVLARLKKTNTLESAVLPRNWDGTILARFCSTLGLSSTSSFRQSWYAVLRARILEEMTPQQLRDFGDLWSLCHLLLSILSVTGSRCRHQLGSGDRRTKHVICYSISAT